MLSQIVGNTIASPSSATMTPDMSDHTVGGTLMNTVEAFKSNVNTMTDTPSDAVTTKARFLDVPPESEPPTITGRSDMVHGASAVSAPAINEMNRKNIYAQNTTCATTDIQLQYVLDAL